MTVVLGQSGSTSVVETTSYDVAARRRVGVSRVTR
jgi:hypothetical protein